MTNDSEMPLSFACYSLQHFPGLGRPPWLGRVAHNGTLGHMNHIVSLLFKLPTFLLPLSCAIYFGQSWTMPWLAVCHRLLSRIFRSKMHTNAGCASLLAIVRGWRSIVFCGGPSIALTFLPKLLSSIPFSMLSIFSVSTPSWRETCFLHCMASVSVSPGQTRISS